MLLNDLLRTKSDHATKHISQQTTINKQCYQCMKMVGVYKSWQHMNCFEKDPKSTLKFFNHLEYGFICLSCYTSGHTFQKLC